MKTVDRVILAKDYEKGMGVHKITFQALWVLLLPQLMEFLEENDQGLKQQLEAAVSEDGDTNLIGVMTSQKYLDMVKQFEEQKGQNPNYTFWFIYLEMVCILLQFTRASPDGLWKLHLESFRKMLLFLHRFGHTNYAKWGSVYLVQMNMLPLEVE